MHSQKKEKQRHLVIPAKAGIQCFHEVAKWLDTGFHRCDDFLREHHLSGTSTIADLDQDRVRFFLERVNGCGRFRVDREWETVLGKLGFLRDGRLTHAAMLLFGKDNPPYSVHIGRFKTPATIID